MKRAIALSGGGTKGAYELGVWKALRELDIDYQIVTGTSIGAINGALMVTGDYDRAFELWNTITMKDMIEDGINLTDTVEGMIEQRDAIRPFLKKYVKNKGADISPFTAFIERLIREDDIRASAIDYGLVTAEFPSMVGRELTKREIPKGLMRDYIMASSAIFPLFPMHRIGEITYVDGCYHDNLPINLALRMGADHVIAVDLHTTPAHISYAHRPYVTYIKPSRPLGTMMNFEHELLMENAHMGYQDAMKVYGVYYGYSYTFYKEGIAAGRRSVSRFLRRMAQADCMISGETPVKRLNKKGDFNHMHVCLRNQSGKEHLSETEYFVAAAEVCGQIFDMERHPIYRMKDFVNELLKRANSIDFIDEIDKILEKDSREMAGVLAELKWHSRLQELTMSIYCRLGEKRMDARAFTAIQALFPEETVAACFLLAVSE
ncbi:MAG: patatin-like phospholipase family protein [Roseburia sp.]